MEEPKKELYDSHDYLEVCVLHYFFPIYKAISDPDHPKRKIYFFEDCEELREILKLFKEDLIEVNPRKFLNTGKSVRSRFRD